MSPKITELNHFDMVMAARKVSSQILEDFKSLVNTAEVINIYGLPRGGIPCAYLVYSFLYNLNVKLVDEVIDADIIIDDIVDSGRTRDQLLEINPNAKFYALFMNPDTWLSLPFERTFDRKDTSIDDAIIRLMEFKHIPTESFEDYKMQLLPELYSG